MEESGQSSQEQNADRNAANRHQAPVSAEKNDCIGSWTPDHV